MGVFQPSRQRTFLSTNDLSAKQFFGVALDASNANSVVISNAQTLPVIGILLNAPVAGDTASVALLGPTTFVSAGAAFAKGARLTVDGNGQVIGTTSAADQVIGIALEAAGALNDRVEMMLITGFYHA